jgi:hypothetical protein
MTALSTTGLKEAGRKFLMSLLLCSNTINPLGNRGAAFLCGHDGVRHLPASPDAQLSNDVEKDWNRWLDSKRPLLQPAIDELVALKKRV